MFQTNTEQKISEDRAIISGKLFKNTPDTIKLKINENKWMIFLTHYGIKNESDLLNFDIGKLKNANVKQLFGCEKIYFIRVLCYPPYSLIKKIKSMKM